MSLSDVTMTESNATRHVNCLRDCLTELQTSRNHLGQLSGNPLLPLPSSWGPRLMHVLRFLFESYFGGSSLFKVGNTDGCFSRSSSS